MKTPRQLATDLTAACNEDGSRFICWDTVDQVADWLREQEDTVNPCPFTSMAHTRHWCGYEGCRDS